MAVVQKDAQPSRVPHADLTMTRPSIRMGAACPGQEEFYAGNDFDLIKSVFPNSRCNAYVWQRLEGSVSSLHRCICHPQNTLM
jgi:hypothetical protein